MSGQRAAIDEIHLEEGAIVKSGGRLWRVGLVNSSRARLDPLTGTVTQADPTSGRSFLSYGQSINISPASLLGEVDVEDLDEFALRRLLTLQERADQESSATKNRRSMAATASFVKQYPSPYASATTFYSDGDDMAIEVVKKVNPAKVAGPVVTGATKAEANKVKAAVKAKQDGVSASQPKAKKAKEVRECACGCGGSTTSYFVPGHDARFKGWLTKVEKGTMKLEELPEAVQGAYVWKKKGNGKVPTKNYKGEPYVGYLPVGDV